MSAINAQKALAVLNNAELICSREDVERALDCMAVEITRRLKHLDPLVLVVMNGAFMPAAHLFTRLDFPFQIDYLHVTRYRGATEGRELNWIVPPRCPLQGRVILVVDDIFDEGATLKAILAHLRQCQAEAVYSAVLVNKQHDRKVAELEVDFIGLQVKDRYVFGCGMDYKEYWRNLPAIYAANESDLS